MKSQSLRASRQAASLTRETECRPKLHLGKVELVGKVKEKRLSEVTTDWLGMSSVASLTTCKGCESALADRPSS